MLTCDISLSDRSTSSSQKLGQTFGPQWTATTLLPKLTEKFEGKSLTSSSPTSGRINHDILTDSGSPSDDGTVVTKPVPYLTRITVLHTLPVRVKFPVLYGVNDYSVIL